MFVNEVLWRFKQPKSCQDFNEYKRYCELMKDLVDDSDQLLEDFMNELRLCPHIGYYYSNLKGGGV